jgi:hypothetical protein
MVFMVGCQNRLMILAASLLIPATAWTASAQSLGDVARKEGERRKAVAPGKVYTNDTLRPTPAPAAPAAPAATPATPAARETAPASAPAAAVPPPAADTVKKDEAYWRTRIKAETDAIERGRVLVEALQSRINGLQTDFVNRDDPASRDSISAERVRALSELDRIKLDIQDRTKALADIREEARRAGVPSTWYR